MKKYLFCWVGMWIIFSASFAAECERLVILGGGPAGLTCALFAAQAHLSPLVIEGHPASGQITSLYEIENYPGFPEGISGKELAKKIKEQAEKFGASFCPNHLVQADLSQRPFQLTFENGEVLACESLVIATGASPRWLQIPGEEALLGKGVSANAAEEGEQFAGQSVCVVGGGDSALEQALILSNLDCQVILCYKGEKLFASAYLQERVHNQPNITVCLGKVVEAIGGEDVGYVTQVSLKDVNTLETCNVDVAAVFVAQGRKPNTDLFLSQIAINDKGYIITLDPTSHTSQKGVFAAGDIVHTAYRKVTTAVASGCIAALDVVKFFQDE